MAQLSSFCRVCLEAKQSNFSLYLHVQAKYLPSVIENICGVLISSFDEPEALICKECALAIIQADEIIQKCQESQKILVEQNKVLRMKVNCLEKRLQVKKEAERNLEQHQNSTNERVNESNINLQRYKVNNKEAYDMSHGIAKAVLEIKQESQEELPDLETLDDSMYVEPEMLVESILENPETNTSSSNSNHIEMPSSPVESTATLIPAHPIPSSMYCSTTKGTKPKNKYVRSREQYLKRKIRNLPIKEPLMLIGGAGVVRKRKPKSFHRAIPNFYFKCELCHEFESNVASYSVTHLNTVHQIERPAIFKCQLCDAKPFIKNQSLQEHISTIHQQQPKPRDFLCTECGKSFIKNCHLQKHLLSVHKRGELPYKCDQAECVGKSYGDQLALKLHMKQAHSGIQPYACELCGKAFAIIYGLRTHMKKAHPVETYSCLQCGYKFTNKTRYETHVKRARCKPPSFVCRHCERTYDKLFRLEEHLKTSHRVDSKYY